jgi:predicted nucleic acid-binding Zn ribbon protein
MSATLLLQHTCITIKEAQHAPMPTYLYETLPPTPDLPVRRFEVKQSMRDDALTHDPETGHPVRRVPQASFYLGGVRSLAVAPLDGGGCCGPGGGACHH